MRRVKLHPPVVITSSAFSTIRFSLDAVGEGHRIRAELLHQLEYRRADAGHIHADVRNVVAVTLLADDLGLSLKVQRLELDPLQNAELAARLPPAAPAPPVPPCRRLAGVIAQPHRAIAERARRKRLPVVPHLPADPPCSAAAG
jgi:hypothetical protein